jgi:Concanavalin A-like lectin/glucanases superfamily
MNIATSTTTTSATTSNTTDEAPRTARMTSAASSMRSGKRGGLALLAALMLMNGLGACVEPEQDGREGEELAAGEELGAVEQATYSGNLGTALGSPVAAGNTNGLTDEFIPTCVSTSTAPDASFTWTAPSAGTYTFDTIGSTFDTVLDIIGLSGASLGCNDDFSGLQSSVTVTLGAGQPVLVVLDGWRVASGAYRLNITQAIPTAGMHLWLRTDAGITLNGNNVARWVDQSGNGRSAAMTIAARQPAYVLGGLNGWPVLRFAGAQSMVLDAATAPTTYTVFVVGKNSRADESFSMILGPGGSNPNNQLRWENGNQAMFVGLGNNLPVTNATVGNTRTYHALALRYDGSTISSYRDGVLRSSSSHSTTGPWRLNQIGAYYDSFFMTGDLAEILIFNRALTEAERQSIGVYLRSKYGLP